MIVLFIQLASDITFVGKYLDSYTIDSWIGNKIFPIAGNVYNQVAYNKFAITDNTGVPTGEYLECALRKTGSTGILITASTMPTSSTYGALVTGGYVRVQFDLIID